MSKLAIARSYDDFRMYCEHHKLNYRDFKYIETSQQLRGLAYAELYLLGSYQLNPYFHEFVDFIDKYCSSHHIRITRLPWQSWE